MKDRPASSSESHRLPVANEVWDRYLSLGTDPPEVHHEVAFRALLSDATRAVSGRTAAGPSRDRSELTGLIRYELGLSVHESQSQEANRLWLAAWKDLSRRTEFQSHDRIGRESLLSTILLLRARLDPNERLHSLQRQATIKQLGRTIATHADLLRGNTDPGGPAMYGELVELAFNATFLADTQTANTLVGAPATERQDKPIGTGIGHKETIPGVQNISSSDISLLTYADTGQLLATTPVQVGSKEEEKEGRYAQHVLTLYADRDLFVATAQELAAYGQALADFSFSSEPDKRLRTACSNIDLARELHAEEQAG